MTCEPQVQLLGLEVDVPLAAHADHVGVEDELLQIQDSVLRLELGNRATHLGLRALVHKQSASNVDAHKLGEGLANKSERHDNGKGSISCRSRFVNRIADAA